MTRKEVVAAALDGSRPPYVPWHLDFTQEAEEKLQRHFNTADLTGVLQNHFLPLGNQIVKFERLGNGRVKDYFGTVWDRSVDKDIGVVEEPLLASPTLQGYEFPDPYGDGSFETIEARISGHPELYALYYMGFSLYERAWILRGMENLLMDFYQNPEFARELLETITEYNLQVIRKALTYPIDGIYFGDDWGQQNGLIMGPKLWREFIYPQLKRMYGEVKKEGRKVFIHSCGDVDELFDDLIEIGLDCFNPFQPEVMDVDSLIKQYSGRLAFHGGLSTQRTLPYGTTRDVAAETAKLLKLGSRGGYIFAPAHAVEGDVPLENMLTFINLLKEQTGFSTGP
ncbi:MAG: uroporphyrinogen decarboxylase family protein [Spirochaetia bacterium]